VKSHFESPARRILVIGAGGGGAQVLDILSRCPDKQPVAVLDNDPAKMGHTLLGVDILGSLDVIEELWQRRAFDAVAIAIVADADYRRAVFDRIDRLGIPLENVIDPTAIIGCGVSLGRGNVIRPLCVLAALVSIGDNNYFGEHVCVGHHARVGSHCTFAPRAATAGWIQVADRVQVGLGANLLGRLRIGERAVIGAGAVVSTDVPPGVTVSASVQ
jgi:sugar O-acyltransferase (sialic acid O-acetyltransferase NeuD family)